MKKIVIIGSTGSIGTQALNIVENNCDEFEVVGLVANSNLELLQKQKDKFGVKNCGLFLNSHDKKSGTEIVHGDECFDIATVNEADIVLIAVSGIAALPYVMKAISAKKTIALANKETLVCAGELIMPIIKNEKINLVPVDSEHSAIWQCLNCGQKKDVRKLILTASGGSFLRMPQEQLRDVTIEKALKHPNWSMGRKITIDSATMFNKGLEVIEASWLFGVDIDNIEVVVHPESVIHSMVEFVDSVVIAQMSYPTMEIPIQLAFTYPKRIISSALSIDFAKLAALHFEKLNDSKFPSVNLVRKVSKMGGLYPTILNCANEVLVERFLEGEIKFLDIYSKVSEILERQWETIPLSLDSIQHISEVTMRIAREI